jgi:hypothetical protein
MVVPQISNKPNDDTFNFGYFISWLISLWWSYEFDYVSCCMGGLPMLPVLVADGFAIT